MKTHQVRGDRYSVWVEYSAAEVEARARAEQARAAQAALDQALAHLPTSAQAYRAWLDAAAASLMQALWLACRDGHGGYRLATAPHDDALGDAFATLREAIAESRIVFDPAAQARAVIAARSGFAKRDEQLQTFLAAQVKAAGA